jgi:DNA-binding NarL/FixJ family response regulator
VITFPDWLSQLLAFVKVDPSTTDLIPGFTRDVRELGHFGTGDVEITLASLDDLEKAKPVLACTHREARQRSAPMMMQFRSGLPALAGEAASAPSNRQIAQTLFLSSKTVEMHLGHVYQELGVHSRAQLAGALNESENIGT